MLAASGVHPKTAMDLMRHSDINLTLGLYTHTLIEDRARATACLPDVTSPTREAKTGTADVPESGGPKGGPKGVQDCPELSKIGHNGESSAVAAAKPEVQEKRPERAVCGPIGAGAGWHPHGESNPGLQTENLPS